MATLDINSLIRDNIRTLVPYSTARDEYSGNDAILLDANENPYNRPYNRYPDPLQRKLKEKICEIMSLSADNLFLGNGSDEAIDLLFRAFCNPGKDNVVTIDPSYGMYEVCANINDVDVRKVLLTDNFQLDSDALLARTDSGTKLIFLCSPNNPTGNLLSTDSVLRILNSFKGLLIMDEAYIDFSGTNGLIHLLPDHNNLVILRTFSKAFGLAGIRLGMAIADRGIIQVLNRIKYPYNLNSLTQELAIKHLDKTSINAKWISTILVSRKKLEKDLVDFSWVQKVYPSDANFLLVKVEEPLALYNYLRKHKLIVRDRSKVSLCFGCLRITVGSENENSTLIELMQGFDRSSKYSND